MIVPNSIYDIRTNEYAQCTLSNLTSVPISVWKQYIDHENEYKYIDDLVLDVIEHHGYMPNNYRDFDYTYFHVTTSSTECASFWNHGILDLKRSYECDDSELKIFLEKHNIYIDLDEQTLTHQGRKFDISFGPCPRRNTEDYRCWSVGRKFYYDYATCGFLSVWDRSPYGGRVHQRPEILLDIDNLLRTNLSQEWASTHKPYEVVATVSGEKIIYDGDDDQSEEDKVLNYLTKAYFTAFQEPTEEILLIKNHVQIPPSDIIEIKPMACWNEYLSTDI